MTFAVFGDNRGSRRVFDPVLQPVNRDRDFSFAVHLGDLVESPDFLKVSVQGSQVHIDLKRVQGPG